MKCRIVRKRISAYLDGELPERDELSAREHLSSCTSCAEEYQSMSFPWEMISAIPRTHPHGSLWPKIEKGLQQELRVDTALWHLASWPFCAVAVCVLAAGLYVGLNLGGLAMNNETRQGTRLGSAREAAEKFENVQYFGDAPPGSLAEGALLPPADARKEGVKP